MEFAKDNQELSFVDSMFETEPHINIIDKERFNDRVNTVFSILYQSLVKSFGPGGAGTFVSIYPKYYNTKDGFTIMKNIAFDKKLDQVICDMVMDICSRLNFTVGDGTTTAVIATKSIYESYLNSKDTFEKMNLLPRDIMARLDSLKDQILNRIDQKAIPIRSYDPEVLAYNIRKVVWVSSNGNEEITNMISDLYKELLYPAISVTLAKDGKMKTKIVSGYNMDISLTDKLYINNDDNTMVLNGANVIIFDHKVTKSTYTNILRPLNRESALRGKHLICIAPYYDEVALQGVIRTDLLAEYNKKKDANLVLTVCKNRGSEKIRLEDLALLLNTQIITTHGELELVTAMETTGTEILSLFDLDNREIEGLPVAYAVDSEHLCLENYHKDNKKKPFSYNPDGNTIRVGYADDIIVGLNESTFSGFYYDEEEYKKRLNIARAELEEIQRKVESNGTFSFDLVTKQDRLYALGLKTGAIEVGASSEISQSYIKDMVDDAVKAAASAYNNGVVLGCNVTMSSILQDMVSHTEDELDKTLLEILLNGFKSVYKSVINNVFEDIPILPNDVIVEDTDEFREKVFNSVLNTLRKNTPCTNIKFDFEDFKKVSTDCTSIHDVLTDMSIANEVVVDLGNHGEFSKLIINSSETDKEILKAVVDLLSLLITGNQMVIC